MKVQLLMKCMSLAHASRITLAAYGIQLLRLLGSIGAVWAFFLLAR